MKYTIHKPAGVMTILVPIEGSTTITTQVFCHAGSIYETKETNGLSHFLEHMFFKGGKRYPDTGSIAKALDAIGADYNAYTSDQYASYYVKSAPEYAMVGLDVLTDMICNASFPEHEITKESGVILQELEMYKDQPRHRMMMNANKWYYGDNSYGWPIIGTEQTITAVTREALLHHQHALYTKDNLFLVIAGHIENEDQMLDFIEKELEGLPDCTSLSKPSFLPYLPELPQASLKQGVNQAHVMIFADAFTVADTKNYYAAKLLSKILGGTTSSRLHLKIREELGLCYYINCGFNSCSEYGTFQIMAGLDKKKLEFGLDAIYKEIKALAQGDIRQDELDLALSNTLGGLQMGIETSDEMADRLGYNYILKNEILTVDQIIEYYQSITLEDLKSIAYKLSRENLYTYRIE